MSTPFTEDYAQHSRPDTQCQAAAPSSDSDSGGDAAGQPLAADDDVAVAPVEPDPATATAATDKVWTDEYVTYLRTLRAVQPPQHRHYSTGGYPRFLAGNEQRRQALLDDRMMDPDFISLDRTRMDTLATSAGSSSFRLRLPDLQLRHTVARYDRDNVEVGTKDVDVVSWYHDSATHSRKVVRDPNARAHFMAGHIFISELPDPNGLGQPLAADHFETFWHCDAEHMFYHLCQKHEGEVVETHGQWVKHGHDPISPNPAEGWYVHHQMAITQEQAGSIKTLNAQQPKTPLIDLSAVGDTTCWKRSDDGGIEVRECRVFSFPTLCLEFLQDYSMRELYWY